ncbi:hypothetical protein JCM1841_005061 [Sporobolomyces salmonicolor]
MRHARFPATKLFYEQAVKAGFGAGSVPNKLERSAGSLIVAALLFILALYSRTALLGLDDVASSPTGMLATSSLYIRHKNLRVPLGNILDEADEKAINIVEGSFTESCVQLPPSAYRSSLLN